jgi:hypothetical protein
MMDEHGGVTKATARRQPHLTFEVGRAAAVQ